jgi:spermidine synthase
VLSTGRAWHDWNVVTSGTVPTRGQSFAVLCLCFLLSGATGLVYQIVWLRMLGLIFGHTVHAITAVLAAFMAGLALGSFVFARSIGRLRNLIAAYGWLETAIGIYCALIPLLLWLASSAHLALHRALGLSLGAFMVVQFLIVFLLLLVPTTLMGGTLPVLSQALATDKADLTRRVGLLYAVNTGGAVLGVALAGYVLLPAFGNRITIGIAALGNLTVGALAIAWSRRSSVPVVGTESAPSRPKPSPQAPSRAERRRRVTAPEPGPPPPPRVPRLGIWLTVAALGVSGAVSMIYEVTWTRALTLVIGSSTYAFSAMLLAFLIGIAGGSALYSALWGTRRATPTTFAALQGALALAVTAIVLLFEQMPVFFLTVLGAAGSPAMLPYVQVLVSVCALLPSTLLIGATFPCAVAVVAHDPRRVGKDVGDIYAVNTVGAIVGVALVGFALIPLFGVHAAIKIGIVVNLAVAAALLTAPPRARIAGGAAAGALIAAALIIFVPPWDQRVMASGPAIYAPSFIGETSAGGIGALLRKAPVIFYRDGPSATVTVEKEGEDLSLRSNGKVEASTLPADMPTQLMLAHLPLLIHPDPKEVLVIGLGSGITVGAAAHHAVRQIEVIEIEPAMVEAARLFARANGDVLDNPRVRITIADGRNFLRTRSARYDVIISEPSNPWIGGLASLFSVEFFDLARQRLNPGGLVAQWLQGYNLLPEDMQMVVRTFRSVFPSTTVWKSTTGDYVLIGRPEPAPLDLHRLRARYESSEAVRNDLATIGIRSWAGILGYFMLDEAGAARLAADGELNTDDRLPLEFRAPRGLFMGTGERNLELVRNARTGDLPSNTARSRALVDQADVRYAIGRVYANRNLWQEALAQFLRASALRPNDTPALLGVSLARIRLGQPTEALGVLSRVLQREPTDAEALAQSGVAYGDLGEQAIAVTYLERAVASEPGNTGYRTLLARARSAKPRPSSPAASRPTAGASH